MNSQKTNKDLDYILESLSTSTKSPSGKYSAKNSFEILDKINGRPKFRKKQYAIIFTFTAVASIILLFVFFNLFNSYNNENCEINILQASSYSKTKKLKLPDGSKVLLNRYSSLKYYEISGNKRVAELEGEAYFEVAKNKKKPFQVKSNGLTINVLGTHFYVNAYPKDSIAETTLLEGSILLRESLKNKKVILKPNESVKINKRTGDLSIYNIDNINEENKRCNGKICINNISIHEIARLLSNYYNKNIIIKNQETDNNRLNAVFDENESLYTILEMLSQTGEFDYVKINSDTIELNIKKK